MSSERPESEFGRMRRIGLDRFTWERAIRDHGSVASFRAYVEASDPYPDDAADDILDIDEETPRWAYDSYERCWAVSLRGDGSRCDGTRYAQQMLIVDEPDEQYPEGIWTEEEVPLCRTHARLYEEQGAEGVEVAAQAVLARSRKRRYEFVERAERYEASLRGEGER